MTSRILTILRKDICCLWPHVLVFWGVMVAVGVVSAKFADRFGPYGSEIFQALPLFQWIACTLLIAALIHQERPMGDEQYWRTRPLAWPELMAAKGIFLAALVNLPVWICHHTIYPTWFSRQIPLTAFLILPAIAFACVTSNLGQPILLFVGAVVGWEMMSPSLVDSLAVSPTLPWLAVSVATVSLVAILLQYSRRRELLAQSILLAGVAGIAAWSRF